MARTKWTQAGTTRQLSANTPALPILPESRKAGMPVHVPEAQCGILKLAMSIAEVGAVHASSTLVWG